MLIAQFFAIKTNISVAQKKLVNNNIDLNVSRASNLLLIKDSFCSISYVSILKFLLNYTRALCFEARCFEATLVVLYVVMAKLLMFIIEFVLPMIYM